MVPSPKVRHMTALNNRHRETKPFLHRKKTSICAVDSFWDGSKLWSFQSKWLAIFIPLQSQDVWVCKGLDFCIIKFSAFWARTMNIIFSNAKQQLQRFFWKLLNARFLVGGPLWRRATKVQKCYLDQACYARVQDLPLDEQFEFFWMTFERL